jgi:hypothetical protein
MVQRGLLVALLGAAALVTACSAATPSADKPATAAAVVATTAVPTTTTPAAPTTTAPAKSPQGNILKAIGQVAWLSEAGGALNPKTDAQFTVTKIGVVHSDDPINAENGKAFEVMFHVTIGSDAALAKELTLDLIDSPIETTSSVDGEQLTPGSSLSVGNPPETFGTNRSYTFGYQYPLDKIEAKGWLTVSANNGPGGGWDYPYSISK